MTPPRPATSRPRIWVVAALAVVVLGTLSVLLARPAAPDHVLILASHLDNHGDDVGPGMETLLSDCLEVLSGATVVHAPALPAQQDLEQLPPKTRLLRFHGKREGDLLNLSLEWSTVGHLLAGKPWTLEAQGAQDPARTMNHLVQHWPLAIRRRHLEALIPKTAAHFWDLHEGRSIRQDQPHANPPARPYRQGDGEPPAAHAGRRAELDQQPGLDQQTGLTATRRPRRPAPAPYRRAPCSRRRPAGRSARRRSSRRRTAR